MDIKKAVTRRINLYKNRKNTGISLKELLAYDTILLFKREERKKARKKLSKCYVKQRYN